MEFWKIIVLYFISHVVIQYGITIRRKIIEKNKLKRIDKLADLDINKIKEIGNYENK